MINIYRIRRSFVEYPDYAVWFIKKYYEIFFISISILLSLFIISIAHWFKYIHDINKSNYIEVVSDTITTLHPLVETNHLLDNSLQVLLYRSLLNVRENGQVMYDLLENFSIKNNYKTYIITLKNNTFWNNGKPITAKDVVFTYNFIKKYLPYSLLGKTLANAKITELNGKQIEFDFKTPYVGFIKELVNPIANASYYNSKNLQDLLHNPYDLNVVTSGNYKINALGIDYIKFYNSKNNFNIEWKYQRTPQQAYHEFIQKKADAYVLNLLDVNILNKLKNTPHVIVSRYPILYEIKGLFFNENKNIPFEYKHKIARILRKNKISLKLGYETAYSIYPESSIYFDKNLLKQEYKVNKDVKNFSIRLSFLDVPEEKRIALILKQILDKNNITVILDPINIEDFQYRIIENHDFQVLLYGLKINSNPDESAFWHSKGKLNIVGLKDSKIDKILEQATITYNTLEREVLYKQLQKEILLNKIVFIPLFHPNLYVAYWDYVNHLKINTNSFPLSNAYMRLLYVYPNVR